MALSILGFPTIVRARIGGIEIDASVSEDHTYFADTTDNPVEDGTVFTDHVVLQPVVLEMEGRISDATQSLLEFRGSGRSLEAFKSLVILQRTKQPFTVTTGINVYQNMIFQELRIIRQALDGRSIRFNATLRELLIFGDDVLTNRDRIAEGVQNTALSSISKGLVTKIPV